MDEPERVATVLWIAHTYVFDHFTMTPRLFATSEDPGCGKTSLLRVVEGLAAQGNRYNRVTPTFLRKATELGKGKDMRPPTLLLDQLDNSLNKEDGALIDAMCSGADKGAKQGLIDRETGKPLNFDFYIPMALGKVGGLPDRALADRVIEIRMHPATDDEFRALYKTARKAADPKVKAALEKAMAGMGEKLTAARPEIPQGLVNRMWDKWLPLIAIAEAAGPKWLERARAAALALEQEVEGDKEPVHIRLLRKAWDKAQVPANDNVVFSAELEDGAIKYPAKLLKKVGLSPSMLRRGVEQKRSFKAADIERAAKRYLKAG